MNLRTSRWSVLGLALFAALSVALFLYMSGRTGGPGLGGGPAYRLRVAFADAGGVTKRSDVLVRGVAVGLVTGVHTSGGATTLTLGLDSARLPLHRDASARIGQKTPLGESFVDLDPGSVKGGPPPDGGRIRGRPSVEMDEALELLNARGRRSLVGVTKTLARGAESPARVRGTLSGLSNTIAAADRLAQTLRGQEGQIAGAVQGTRSLLDALGAHDASVRSLVRDSRTALAATAAQRGAVQASLHELPGLLSDARGTLADATPLLVEARPAAGQMRKAAPELSAALRDAPSTLRAARQAIEGGPALATAAQPALAAARALLPVAKPAVDKLGPALANVVPMARYLAPRANTVAAWFANTADLGSHGDAKGKWARFFVLFDPPTAAGAQPSPRGNSYTAPNDAAHNVAYASGSYPRLLPFGPALRRGTAARNEGP